MLVDVAVGALEVDSRSSPSSSVGVGRGQVSRLGTTVPVVQLDVVAGPLNGVYIELDFDYPLRKGKLCTYRYRRSWRPRDPCCRWQCIPG